MSDLEGIKLDCDPILIAHSSSSFNTQLKCHLFSKHSLTSTGKVKYFLFWSPSAPHSRSLDTDVIFDRWTGCSFLNPSASGIPFLLLLHFLVQSLVRNNYICLHKMKFLKLAKSEAGNSFIKIMFLFSLISLSLALLIVTIPHLTYIHYVSSTLVPWFTQYFFHVNFFTCGKYSPHSHRLLTCDFHLHGLISRSFFFFIPIIGDYSKKTIA